MQTIEIKVFPKAKRKEVKKENELYKVYVTSPAEDGKANKAVLGVLADYFGVKKADINIIKGLKSRHKTITIGEV